MARADQHRPSRIGRRLVLRGDSYRPVRPSRLALAVSDRGRGQGPATWRPSFSRSADAKGEHAAGHPGLAPCTEGRPLSRTDNGITVVRVPAAIAVASVGTGKDGEFAPPTISEAQVAAWDSGMFSASVRLPGRSMSSSCGKGSAEKSIRTNSDPVSRACYVAYFGVLSATEDWPRAERALIDAVRFAAEVADPRTRAEVQAYIGVLTAETAESLSRSVLLEARKSVSELESPASRARSQAYLAALARKANPEASALFLSDARASAAEVTSPSDRAQSLLRVGLSLTAKACGPAQDPQIMASLISIADDAASASSLVPSAPERAVLLAKVASLEFLLDKARGRKILDLAREAAGGVADPAQRSSALAEIGVLITESDARLSGQLLELAKAATDEITDEYKSDLALHKVCETILPNDPRRAETYARQIHDEFLRDSILSAASASA